MLEQTLPIARAAGNAILQVYAKDFDVRDKVDASPVTEADDRAKEHILVALAALTPDVPIVSEEAAARHSRFIVTELTPRDLPVVASEATSA